MFITKKHLRRRTFLKGAGVALALPLLDAMIPAHTALAKTAAAPKMRLGYFYFPHGAIMDKWTPAKEGTDYELSPILTPLKAFQNQLTVVSGLGNRPASPAPCTPSCPARGFPACIRARRMSLSVASRPIRWRPRTSDRKRRCRRSKCAPRRAGGGGACDRAYGCSYSGTIAFRTPSTPLPMEYNPRTLFQRLFGRGSSPEERALLSKQYASVLDMVTTEASSLQGKLGPADRAALGDYLESIREIERRVQKTNAQDLSKLALPDVPVGVPDSFPEHQTLMLDIIALAYQADLTRIVNFMFAAEVSNMTYNHIGISDAFHAVSHHQNDPTKKDKLVRIQTWHTEQFARFLKKIQAIPDGDGNLLDHSMFLYGSNMSNSDAHNQFPLPTAIVGGGCGKMKAGRHVKYTDHTPLANVLLTMLEKSGVPDKKLGDSTGTMAEI